MCFVSEGSFDYHKLRDTPLNELLLIHKEATRIQKARKAEADKLGR